MITAGKHFFNRQLIHLSVYVLLIILSPHVVNMEALGRLSLWGVNGRVYFFISLLMAPLHQFYVWFVWRSELYYKRISPLFGGHGFRAHAVLFAFIAIFRIISVVLAGVVDRGSVSFHWSIMWILAPAITVLAVYAFYSTFRYFGYERAVGADHFFPEYRAKPFVRKGIFKYSSNSMYTFAMLFLFLIGILSASKAALYLGAYHYVTTWAHYFCTEKPDIKEIYGPR